VLAVEVVATGLCVATNTRLPHKPQHTARSIGRVHLQEGDLHDRRIQSWVDHSYRGSIAGIQFLTDDTGGQSIGCLRTRLARISASAIRNWRFLLAVVQTNHFRVHQLTGVRQQPDSLWSGIHSSSFDPTLFGLLVTDEIRRTAFRSFSEMSGAPAGPARSKPSRNRLALYALRRIQGVSRFGSWFASCYLLRRLGVIGRARDRVSSPNA